MRIRLYFDEDSMRRSLVRALASRGVDVETALDADMVERSDVDHLEYASRHGRVLCSYNTGDFYRLHTEFVAQGRSHAGVILMRQQYHSIGDQMRTFLKCVATVTAADMVNRVEFLNAWHQRG